MPNIEGLEEIYDTNYRYQMPCIQIRHEKAKTIIVNIEEISKALKRNSTELIKYISISLSTQHKNYTLSGSYSIVDINKWIHQYIEDFILCNRCRLPETNYVVNENKLHKSCESCGSKSEIKEHKLLKYILSNVEDHSFVRSKSMTILNSVDLEVEDKGTSYKETSYMMKFKDLINRQELSDSETSELDVELSNLLNVIFEKLENLKDSFTENKEKISLCNKKQLFDLFVSKIEENDLLDEITDLLEFLYFEDFIEESDFVDWYENCKNCNKHATDEFYSWLVNND